MVTPGGVHMPPWFPDGTWKLVTRPPPSTDVDTTQPWYFPQSPKRPPNGMYTRPPATDSAPRSPARGGTRAGGGGAGPARAGPRPRGPRAGWGGGGGGGGPGGPRGGRRARWWRGRGGGGPPSGPTSPAAVVPPSWTTRRRPPR